MKKFSERLRHLRKQILSLTLKAFADGVGTSQGYLHELESGRKENPSSEFLQRISEKFGIRRQWLETGEGEPRSGSSEEPAVYRFDYKTDAGCRAAFEYLLETMPLSDLLQRLGKILNDESQAPELRLQMAKAMMPVIERRKAELESKSLGQQTTQKPTSLANT